MISENVLESANCSVEVVGGVQGQESTSLQGSAMDVSGNMVIDLKFVRNVLRKGGIQLVGAGGQLTPSTLLACENSIDGVVIELNQISECGANGVQIGGGSNGAQNNTVKNVTIRNNLIVKNHGAGISLLGGYQSSSNNIISNVTILNNTIAENGLNSGWAGGININDNNTSYGNSVFGVTITNTILWGNMWGDSICGPIPPDLVQFSIVGDPRYINNNGNFYLSPEFVDPQNMNYRLKEGSPAIDRGNPNTNAITVGKFDLGGKYRIIDGNQDGVALVDIGAYEYVPTSTTGIRLGVADFDGDGKTDIAVYRVSTGAWWIKPSGGGSSYGVGFGGDPSDHPVTTNFSSLY